MGQAPGIVSQDSATGPTVSVTPPHQKGKSESSCPGHQRAKATFPVTLSTPWFDPSSGSKQGPLDAHLFQQKTCSSCGICQAPC